MAGLADANILIDETVGTFKSQMMKTGTFAWLHSVGPLNRMNQDEAGKVFPSAQSTQAVQATAVAMSNATLTNVYFQRVESLKTPLPEISQIIEDYYTNNFGDLTQVVKGKIPGMISNAEKEINDMMGQEAVQIAIIDPTIAALSQHITNRSTHNAMMKDMDIRVKDRYEKFSGPRAEDILQRFARNMNDLMAIGFQLSWVKYVGGLIDTSRDFCIEKDGGYYHVSEVKL
ncbi:hypothetical protein KAR91_60510, partial [Candidatus Pacearchaeota archaeon]|nr:hypothetical protein [Candidatus Pacearchaeota archaeon]